MQKKLYSYKDWFEGKVYLETCAIIIPKNEKDKLIKVNNSFFSAQSLKLIESKQKEIFLDKAIELFKTFKRIFSKQFKSSKAKELFLKRELDDIRKILYLLPIQDLNFKNRTFTLFKNDLMIIRKYIDSQLIKGEEYFGFVHSPNFKFQHEKITNDFVYAKATFDYYNWLVEFNKFSKKEKISKKSKIKVKVIALIYFYNRIEINRINCNEIASKYGYNSKTSGEGLYQDYIKVSANSYRTKVVNESKFKCNYRLKLLDSAIKYLDGKSKSNALKDFKILESAIEENEW
jgi:hypothetical protein